MQVSSAKIKTDWEKLEEVKIEDSKLKNKLITKKSIKENNLILKSLRQFYSQPIFGLETFFTIYLQYQKQTFDNLEIDQNVISEFGKFWDMVIKESGVSMDAYVRFSQTQSEILEHILEMYSNFFSQILDWHSKIMSNFVTKKYR